MRNMWQTINSIKYSYMLYSGSGINLALICLTVIYLYIQGQQRKKRNLLYLVCVLLILLLNPFTANNIMTFVTPEIGYWMAFMVIPSAIFISYGITKGVITQDTKRNQRVVGGICILLLLISTNFTFVLEDIHLIDGKYKITDEAMEVQQIVSQAGEMYVIAPREIAEQLREYDASIRVLGGDTEKWSALEDISNNWTNMEKLADYAALYGCNCIIYPREHEEGAAQLDSIKFTVMAQTENYYICFYQY